MMIKILGAVAVLAALGFSHWYAYDSGAQNGANGIQVQWDRDEKLRTAEINKLKGEIALKEKQHTKVQEELTLELSTATSNYNAALLTAYAEFADRLSTSEKRAGVYQRQARGSAAEQNRLARHAAELDRTLEEGRSLVRELGQTLRQREVTIRALGGIILNDRTLLETK